MMNMTVIEIIVLGKKYMKLWPNRAELAHYFEEYRTIQLSRFVCRYFPALAIITGLFPFYFNEQSSFSQAIFYSLFILCMPVQALVMLGMKADKHLTPSLASWYKEGIARAIEQGSNIKLSVHKPRYVDLAQLLNITYSK
jgi:uncharacterized membrane protein YfbV (UPF0208 family)